MKNNKPLESEIQRLICEWLALKGYFFWRSNNIPVFGLSNDGQRRFRALPKFTPRGLPDIIIIHKGKFVAIEVKRNEKEKLRPEQAEFAVKCVINGGCYFKVSSLDDMLRIPQLYA